MHVAMLEPGGALKQITNYFAFNTNPIDKESGCPN